MFLFIRNIVHKFNKLLLLLLIFVIIVIRQWTWFCSNGICNSFNFRCQRMKFCSVLHTFSNLWIIATRDNESKTMMVWYIQSYCLFHQQLECWNGILNSFVTFITINAYKYDVTCHSVTQFIIVDCSFVIVNAFFCFCTFAHFVLSGRLCWSRNRWRRKL